MVNLASRLAFQRILCSIHKRIKQILRVEGGSNGRNVGKTWKIAGKNRIFRYVIEENEDEHRSKEHKWKNERKGLTENENWSVHRCGLVENPKQKP